jgi:hypothetical protein
LIDLSTQGIRGTGNLNGFLYQFGILFQIGPGGIPQHGNGQVTQGNDFFLNRVRGPVDDFKDVVRDTFRIIPDPFNFQVDLYGAIGKAQRSGHRLLAHQKFQAKPIDFLFFFVNKLVPQDNGDIVTEDSRIFIQGFLQGFLGQLGHLFDIFTDSFNVPMQGFFQICLHYYSFPSRPVRMP